MWNFCGGWKPELIGIAADYYGAADVDHLIDLLIAMRECFSEHQQAQAE